jgi:IclR family transcriptional regulator, acetate operon repressor
MPGQNAGRDQFSKALDVLRLIVESGQGSWGVRELATTLGLAPSTVHRVLLLLEQHDLLESEDGRYRLGLEFLRLAWRVGDYLPLRRIALPAMRELVAQCNETALLGICDYAHMAAMHIASVESPNPLRYFVELNQWIPQHANPGGLAVLACLPDDEITKFLNSAELSPVTEMTLTEPEAIQRAITSIRERGYAITHGAHIPGAVGVAAAIRAGAARPAGYVMLTIPEQRYSAQNEGELADLVVQCAQTISSSLD